MGRGYEMAAKANDNLLQRNRELQERLEEAEQIIRALREGEVDALVLSGSDGERVYTLRGAEQPYRVMVEGMAEGALTVSADGLILFSNEQFATMAGSPLERVMGGRLQDFVAAEDVEMVSALLAGTHRRKAEVRLKRNGRPAVPVYLSIENLILDGVEGLCIIVTDLSEQKRSQEIVAAEKLARSILEQAADAILVVDAEGCITRASRAASRLAGAAVLQRQFDEVFHIELGSGPPLSFRAILSSARQKHRIKDLEGTAVRRDGRKIELL